MTAPKTKKPALDSTTNPPSNRIETSNDSLNSLTKTTMMHPGNKEMLATFAAEFVGLPFLDLLSHSIRDNRPLPVAVTIAIVLKATKAGLRRRISTNYLGISRQMRLFLPESVFVTELGEVLLTEISPKQRVSSNPQPLLSRSVLAQLAPEELAKDAKFVVGSEVFSLGVLLWSALTGRQLFTEYEASVSHGNVLRSDIPALNRFHPFTACEFAPVVAVVRKATERNLANRYPSLVEFQVALESLPPNFIATEDEIAVVLRAAINRLAHAPPTSGLVGRTHPVSRVNREMPKVDSVGEHPLDGDVELKEDERPTVPRCPRANSMFPPSLAASGSRNPSTQAGGGMLTVPPNSRTREIQQYADLQEAKTRIDGFVGQVREFLSLIAK
jgi:hypothetical protein